MEVGVSVWDMVKKSWVVFLLLGGRGEIDELGGWFYGVMYDEFFGGVGFGERGWGDNEYGGGVI